MTFVKLPMPKIRKKGKITSNWKIFQTPCQLFNCPFTVVPSSRRDSEVREEYKYDILVSCPDAGIWWWYPVVTLRDSVVTLFMPVITGVIQSINKSLNWYQFVFLFCICIKPKDGKNLVSDIYKLEVYLLLSVQNNPC